MVPAGSAIFVQMPDTVSASIISVGNGLAAGPGDLEGPVEGVIGMVPTSALASFEVSRLPAASKVRVVAPVSGLVTPVWSLKAIVGVDGRRAHAGR